MASCISISIRLLLIQWKILYDGSYEDGFFLRLCELQAIPRCEKMGSTGVVEEPEVGENHTILGSDPLKSRQVSQANDALRISKFPKHPQSLPLGPLPLPAIGASPRTCVGPGLGFSGLGRSLTAATTQVWPATVREAAHEAIRMANGPSLFNSSQQAT